MRLLQVRVPDDDLEAVTTTLDDEDIDYVRQQVHADDEQHWLVEFPIPTDAIGYVLGELEDAGVETDQYTIIASVESAMTPHAEDLQARFAGDFDPLTRSELRSKARDMSNDTTSFVSMIFLSAVIAVAGLLVGSPAVVVGSMVIAPIVGPVLTAAVGATTGDRKMLVNSLWLQVLGLAVAIAGAAAFSYALQLLGFFPRTLDIGTIDLIAVRIAPNFVSVVVGLAAGGAAALGLTTKGPTSLIGVMIAAALIPAAATVGIAAVWAEYRIALGSLFLLLVTMVVINVSAFAVLLWLEYQPQESGWLLPSEHSTQWLLVVATGVLLVATVGVVGAATAQQVGFEQTVSEEVEAVLDDPEYAETKPVTVQIQYSGAGPFSSPETVTVTASRTANGSDPPKIADAIDRRITQATGREVDVRVQFVAYQQSDTNQSVATPGSDVNARLDSPLPRAIAGSPGI